MKKLLQKYNSMPVQIKASFIYLICLFLSRGISVITTPIYTRLMTTSEYGEFSVYNSWVTIITCFTTLNLSGGVYAQSLVKFRNQKNKFASSFQGLTLTLSLLASVIYIILQRWINPLLGFSTVQMILMFAIIWSTAVHQLWAVEQRTDYKYKMMAAVSILVTICSPLVTVLFLVIFEDKVMARILAWALIQMIAYTGLFISDMSKGKSFCSLEIWKYALRMAVPLIPHYLSQMILNSSDRIMIQKMVDDSSAGVYSLAYSISLIMLIFNTSLLSTIEPWVYQKIKQKETDKIAGVAYPCFVLIAVVNLLLIVLAPEIIRIFAPVEYYEAIWVIPPITMSVFFMFSYSFFAMFEFYFEKPHYITIATLTGAVLNIILNYIFIKVYGYYAAGYTTLACYIIYAFMHYLFMRKVIREKMNGVEVYNVRIIVAISIGFVIVAFALMATYHYSPIRYIALAMMVSVLIIKRNYVKTSVKNIIQMRKKN